MRGQAGFARPGPLGSRRLESGQAGAEDAAVCLGEQDRDGAARWRELVAVGCPGCAR